MALTRKAKQSMGSKHSRKTVSCRGGSGRHPSSLPHHWEMFWAKGLKTYEWWPPADDPAANNKSGKPLGGAGEHLPVLTNSVISFSSRLSSSEVALILGNLEEISTFQQMLVQSLEDCTKLVKSCNTAASSQFHNKQRDI